MSRWPIPETWCWAKTANIALIIGGGTPSTKSPRNFSNKGIPWITPSDLSNYRDEYISRGSRDLSEEGYKSCGAQLMPKDTVLFTSRAPVGYCVLAANEICTNQGFKSLVLKGGINSKFIRQYLLYSKDYAESLSSGSTFKELSGKRMATLEVPIPPLNEQNRIVTKLEELQSHSRRAREALETIPDLLEQLRQSILAAAFRGDLSKKWREQQKGQIEPASELLKRIRIERRKCWEETELNKLKAKGFTGDQLDAQFARRRKQYQEPDAVDTEDLPELPKGWCWAALSLLSWNSSYGTSTKCDYTGEGNPVIRIPNVLNGKIETSDMKYSLNEIDITPSEFLSINDMLIVRTNGSINLIGKCAMIEKYFERPTYFASYLIRYRLCGSQNLARWVSFLWESPTIRRKIESMASTSAGQYNLNLNKLNSVLLPIPPGQEIDAAISLLQSSFDRLLFLREHSVDIEDRLIKVDQSILFKAFQGELVLQDPNDEPASILLERIRQEKERQAAKGKTEPRTKGKKMRKSKAEPQDMISVLRQAGRAMTPEELFAAGGFDEESVDSFYEQLRTAILTKKIRETRQGATIKMEALV